MAGMKKADSGCCAKDRLLGSELVLRVERGLVRQATHWHEEESSG